MADACMAIAGNPLEAGNLTSRSNLVAVVTNGTAVLGLGNIGPLAGKSVMEGKDCLFKKFAGIDVFDIELDENDPDALIETIARMEPTFGGINLEDIKAPECFHIETKLRERGEPVHAGMPALEMTKGFDTNCHSCQRSRPWMPM